MGTGQRMIDPETGLELEVLTPTPVMWSQDSVRGRMLAADPTQGGAAAGENPFVQALSVDQVIPDPTIASGAAAPLDMGVAADGGSSRLRPSSFLDKVLFTAFGTPDSMMSPEEESAKHQKRNEAASLATAAANNPGGAHMGIPTASGGSSFGEILQFLPKLIAGLGGIA